MVLQVKLLQYKLFGGELFDVDNIVVHRLDPKDSSIYFLWNLCVDVVVDSGRA